VLPIKGSADASNLCHSFLTYSRYDEDESDTPSIQGTTPAPVGPHLESKNASSVQAGKALSSKPSGVFGKRNVNGFETAMKITDILDREEVVLELKLPKTLGEGKKYRRS
jgi:hypothetical protein